jgi:hypothetical protein
LPKLEKKIRWVQWTARILSIPIILLYGSILVQGFTETNFNNLTAEDCFGFIVLIIFWVSSLLAWKFERFGGVGILIGCGIFLLGLIPYIGTASLLENITALMLLVIYSTLMGSLFVYSSVIKKKLPAQEK